MLLNGDQNTEYMTRTVTQSSLEEPLAQYGLKSNPTEVNSDMSYQRQLPGECACFFKNAPVPPALREDSYTSNIL